MNSVLLQISFYALVAATLLGIARLWRGPTVVDRILAFDAIVLCGVGIILLLSRIWETPLYLDLVIIVSALGFLGTVALVAYLQRTMPDAGGAGAASGAPRERERGGPSVAGERGGPQS